MSIFELSKEKGYESLWICALLVTHGHLKLLALVVPFLRCSEVFVQIR